MFSSLSQRMPTAFSFLWGLAAFELRGLFLQYCNNSTRSPLILSISLQCCCETFCFARFYQPALYRKCVFVPVMCPSHFVESESSKIFSSRVRVMTWSSQSRVTRTVESLRVIGLQARVNFESHEISRFFYKIFLPWNGAQHAIKWRPITLKMVPNMQWYGTR